MNFVEKPYHWYDISPRINVINVWNRLKKVPAVFSLTSADAAINIPGWFVLLGILNLASQPIPASFLSDQAVWVTTKQICRPIDFVINSTWDQKIEISAQICETPFIFCITDISRVKKWTIDPDRLTHILLLILYMHHIIRSIKYA